MGSPTPLLGGIRPRRLMLSCGFVLALISVVACRTTTPSAPPRFDDLLLPRPTLPPDGAGLPLAWLIVADAAWPARPFRIAPAPAVAHALPPVALPAAATPVVIIDAPVVASFQAALQPDQPAQEARPAAVSRPLAATRQRQPALSAFALEPIAVSGGQVLHIVAVVATEPAGPADDPAVIEVHYLWRIISAP